MKRVWMLYAALFTATLLLVTPLAYLLSHALSAQHTGLGIGTLLEQYQQSKRNPLLTALLSGFPFMLLAAIIWVAQRRGATVRTSRDLTLGGGTAILLVMLWANLEYWPRFLPGLPYPGFPHGLELVIAPLHFAPFAMALGAFIGWLAGRSR